MRGHTPADSLPAHKQAMSCVNACDFRSAAGKNAQLQLQDSEAAQHVLVPPGLLGRK